MFAGMNLAQWLTLAALVVLGLVALLVLLTGCWGLFQARSLLRRELSSYFLSPIAYVVLVVFLGVTGHLFALTVEQLTNTGPEGLEYPMQFLLGDERFWLVFLFIPPLLTMRLFAEERSTGTLEMLMTAPVRDWQVVLCKFVACYAFFLLLLLPTLLYWPVLLDLQVTILPRDQWGQAMTASSILLVAGVGVMLLGLLLLWPHLGTGGRVVSLVCIVGGLAAAVVGGIAHYHGLGGQPPDAVHLVTMHAGLDPAPVLTAYGGMILAGAMFIALGMFISSLVRDQLVAAIVSLALSLPFVAAGFWRPSLDTGDLVYRIMYFLSVPLHFQRAFTRGLLDTRPLILYASVALFCLFLTVRSLESRRWR